jgi:signal transduction histidine kinase
MSQRTVLRFAWVVFGLTFVTYVASFMLALLNRSSHAAAVAQRDSAEVGSIVFYSVMLSFAVVGMLILSRQPRNTIAWIFLAIALSWELWWLGAGYLQYGVDTSPGSVPAPALVAALTTWLWAPAIVLMGAFLLLLFPDGRLLSPRWRPLAWLSGMALVLASITDLFRTSSMTNMGFPGIRNPLAIEAIQPILKVLDISVALIPLCMIGCAVSLIQRFRRSQGVTRLQLKWLAVAAGAVAIGYVLFWAANIPFVSDPTPPLWSQLLDAAAVFSFALIPVAAGIAILKHRLYDINVVINKALVFGSLAAFITAVYVAIVVGIGAVVGSGDKPSLALSIAATAIVAIAFQPVRERVQRVANRLVYGQRATPYEVLTRFSRSLGALVSVDDVLPEIARHTAEGLGAERVVVTAYVENGKEAATFPEDTQPRAAADEVIPVTYHDEAVGTIEVTKPDSEPFASHERKLLDQLATHAGVVLHNFRLAVELRARIHELSAQAEDLRDSRERLVSAADTSRRSIEHAIRAGVENRLMGIADELNAAQALMAGDPTHATALLERVAMATNDTLEALRDLARGIYPPLLADKGLVMALEAHVRKIGSQATLQVDDALMEQRFDRSVETACYFCLREALDNAAGYADGAPTTVTIERRDERLWFSVRDEGPGFEPPRPLGFGLQSMMDRVAASGGELTLESAPGRGTTVRGWVPLKVDPEDEGPAQEPEAAAQASSS